MPKITYGEAELTLINFITECDLDELAHVFSQTFGYDVMIDTENNLLECTPNNDCGFILEAEGGKINVPLSDT